MLHEAPNRIRRMRCGAKEFLHAETRRRGGGLHHRPASFDKLRMREDFGGTKIDPHPELVEGRTVLIPASDFSAPPRLRVTEAAARREG